MATLPVQSQLYITTILLIGDYKHAKTVKLEKWPQTSHIPISVAYSRCPLKAACDFALLDLFPYQNKQMKKSVSFGQNLNHSDVNSPTYFHFCVLWNKGVCLLQKVFQKEQSRIYLIVYFKYVQFIL